VPNAKATIDNGPSTPDGTFSARPSTLESGAFPSQYVDANGALRGTATSIEENSKKIDVKDFEFQRKRVVMIYLLPMLRIGLKAVARAKRATNNKTLNIIFCDRGF
jgi:hypothetical protein